MGCNDIRRPANKGIPAIRSKDNGGCHGRFQKGIEVSEAFNIQHVNLFTDLRVSVAVVSTDASYLVDENNTWYNLGYALINIAFDHFVDFLS